MNIVITLSCKNCDHYEKEERFCKLHSEDLDEDWINEGCENHSKGIADEFTI